MQWGGQALVNATANGRMRRWVGKFAGAFGLPARVPQLLPQAGDLSLVFEYCISRIRCRQSPLLAWDKSCATLRWVLSGSMRALVGEYLVGNERVVWVTGAGQVRYCSKCGQPEGECRCREERRMGNSSAAPRDGFVRLALDRKQRRGKSVTIISGLPTDLAN